MDDSRVVFVDFEVVTADDALEDVGVGTGIDNFSR